MFFLSLLAVAPLFQNCGPQFSVLDKYSAASTFSDPLAPGLTMTIGSRTLTLTPADSVVVGQSYSITNKTMATLSVKSAPVGNCLRTTSTAFSCAFGGSVSVSTDPTSTDKTLHETALPVVTENDLASMGASVYGARCASCHAPLASSTKRSRNLIQISDSMVAVADMRSLSSLSSTELIALKVALSGAATPPPTPAPTPTLTQGQLLFANKCASCHGGMRGRSAGAITDAINNVSAMKIPSLMSLTPAEIQMIADAIR